MPTVPVSQGNRERLNPVPALRNEAVDISATGRALGEGLASLGQAASRAVEGFDQIQDVYDEHDARRLDVEHSRRVHEIRRRVRQARGIAAQPAAAQAERDLQEIEREFLGRTRSRNARQLLGPLLSRRTESERENHLDYADQQTTVAVDAGYTARIETSTDEAEENWANPELQERSLQTALGEIERRGHWRGAEPGTIANERAEVTSRVRSSVVTQMAQAERYAEADAYLEAHAGEIEHDTEVALRRMVNGGLRDLEDDSNANWAIGADSAPGEAPSAAPAPPAAANDTAPTPAPSAREGSPQRRVSAPPGYRIGDHAGAPRPGGVHRGMDAHAAAGTPWRVGRPFEIVESHVQQVVRNGRSGGNIATVRIGATEWKAMHLPDLPRAGSYGADATVLRAGSSGSARPGREHIHWQPANAAAQAIYDRGPQATTAFLTGGGTAGEAQAAGASPPASGMIDVERAYARIDARTDLTPSAKLRARDRVRSLANERLAARSRAEEEAGRTADLWLAENGDTYTNPADIPGYTHLSPSRQANLADRARQNARGEGRPVTDQMLLEYNFQRYANPQYFASPEFRQRLITQGAPTALLRQWGADAGTMLGQSTAQRAQQVTDERLWSIANPILREIGLDFDRVNRTDGATGQRGRELTAQERMDDTRRKNRMLTRLRELSTIWTQAHPGQVPDDAQMRGWVANLLASGGPGATTYNFEYDDQTQFQRMNPADRQAAETALRAAGAPVTPENIVRFYRRRIALRSQPRR